MSAVGSFGSGFQPAMMRAHSRAWAAASSVVSQRHGIHRRSLWRCGADPAACGMRQCLSACWCQRGDIAHAVVVDQPFGAAQRCEYTLDASGLPTEVTLERTGAHDADEHIITLRGLTGVVGVGVGEKSNA